MTLVEKKRNHRLKTIFIENVINDDTATEMFQFLKITTDWDVGIKSKKGFTRFGASINYKERPDIEKTIKNVLEKFPTIYNYLVMGIYLNYYQDGEMWTPNHSHPKLHQLIISLGTTRTLTVAKKEYKMTNGSAIMFGSSVHGVPKENVTGDRLSIAVFMLPFNKK